MTTNNHPAHGPVSLERLHQIREILSKAAAQSDGGNLGYAMADAVKVIDGAISAFGVEPVGEVIEQQSGVMMDGLFVSEKPTYRNIKGIHKMKMMPLGTKFYTAVNLESAMEQGAVPDGDTILWWLRQSSEARSAICVDDAMPISSALSELSYFINRHSDNPKYLKVWGNGATFDNVILRGAYERAGQGCPWQFWNDHDVRTIVTLGRSVGFDPKRDMPFDGDMHNALDDARHQAKYVSAIWQKLIPAE